MVNLVANSDPSGILYVRTRTDGILYGRWNIVEHTSSARPRFRFSCPSNSEPRDLRHGRALTQELGESYLGNEIPPLEYIGFDAETGDESPVWIDPKQSSSIEWIPRIRKNSFLDLRSVSRPCFFQTLPVRGWIQSEGPPPESYFPYRFPQARNGEGPVHLLCHGFTGDPLNWRYIEDWLDGRNWPYLSVLLPGHGQSRNRFQNTRWQEWQNIVRRAVDTIDDRPLVGWGLSMGGLIMLENADLFDAIVAINLPWSLHDWRAPLLPVVKYLMPYHVGEEGGKVIPTSAIEQLQRLLWDVKPRLGQIKKPVLIINHMDDEVVPPEDGKNFLARIPRAKRITMSAGGHESPCNPQVVSELTAKIQKWLESLPLEFS